MVIQGNAYGVKVRATARRLVFFLPVFTERLAVFTERLAT
jgi:hypothetical protein